MCIRDRPNTAQAIAANATPPAIMAGNFHPPVDLTAVERSIDSDFSFSEMSISELTIPVRPALFGSPYWRVVKCNCPTMLYATWGQVDWVLSDLRYLVSPTGCGYWEQGGGLVRAGASNGEQNLVQFA